MRKHQNLEQIIGSIESAPAATAFQRKQWDQIVAHIKDQRSAILQFVLIPATSNMKDGFGDQSKLFPPPSSGSGSHDAVSLAITLQYRVARGHVHITSADPTASPAVHPNYAGHAADAALLSAGLKFAEKLVAAPSLRGKMGPRLHPEPGRFPLASPADHRAAAAEYVGGQYHSCGTCAMGETVDARLRVRGVPNLHVVDASVFANNVSGNIVSSVYMIAERAADLIKEDWDWAALGLAHAK